MNIIFPSLSLFRSDLSIPIVMELSDINIKCDDTTNGEYLLSYNKKVRKSFTTEKEREYRKDYEVNNTYIFTNVNKIRMEKSKNYFDKLLVLETTDRIANEFTGYEFDSYAYEDNIRNVTISENLNFDTIFKFINEWFNKS